MREQAITHYNTQLPDSHETYTADLVRRAKESPLSHAFVGELGYELERILRLPSPTKEQLLVQFLLSCSPPTQL